MLHSLLRKRVRLGAPFSAFRRFCCRPLKTAVLSFGDGSHGALGLPATSFGGEDAYEPTRITYLPPHISGIGAGHYHSLAVTADGELWAWGRNEDGQLGRGPSSSVPRWGSSFRSKPMSWIFPSFFLFQFGMILFF